MPRGEKSKYTDKQERKADHIAEGYEKRGVSDKEAERRAWATVNKDDVAFVGERLGDEEDKQGRPFVGPAGRLFDRALSETGIDRSRVYVTNAVKQFKFVQCGKRRIHEKPSMADVTLYRWWLKRELDFVEPSLVVSLGATAALALAGRRMTITKERGPSAFDGRRGFVTVHPSYLLRIPDDEARETAYVALLADLHAVARLASLSTHGGR
jgi:uracil-DNA glycosylase family protein